MSRNISAFATASSAQSSGQLSKTCWAMSPADSLGLNRNSFVLPLTNINFKLTLSVGMLLGLILGTVGILADETSNPNGCKPLNTKAPRQLFNAMTAAEARARSREKRTRTQLHFHVTSLWRECHGARTDYITAEAEHTLSQWSGPHPRSSTLFATTLFNTINNTPVAPDWLGKHSNGETRDRKSVV